MLPRYIAPALDFFDAFLTGRGRPCGRAARALAPAARRLAGVARAGRRRAPPSCASTSATPERAGADAAGGSLVPEPGERSEATWVHDPENLVPRRSSTRSRPCTSIPDERAVESRPDVLTFTTPEWDEPVTLAGRVVAHLDVSSDAPSLFLHVKLVDVHGRPRPRAAVRPGGRDRPGRGAAVEVYLGHTGYRVQPGHRLRLHVASSDFPVFLPIRAPRRTRGTRRRRARTGRRWPRAARRRRTSA